MVGARPNGWIADPKPLLQPADPATGTFLTTLNDVFSVVSFFWDRNPALTLDPVRQPIS